jgi:hypothetical protein
VQGVIGQQECHRQDAGADKRVHLHSHDHTNVSKVRSGRRLAQLVPATHEHRLTRARLHDRNAGRSGRRR